MTVKEIIELQDATGRLYLLRQGLFYRGYNQAAALLNTLFNYQVKEKNVISCGRNVFYAGFPALAEEKVVERILKQGGVMSQFEKGVLEISGIPVFYDELTLSGIVENFRHRRAEKEIHSEKEQALAVEIAGFNLLENTPLECNRKPYGSLF